MPEDCAIVVDDLTKKYHGHVALDGVSFSVRRGAVVGLIGPNGAGKSSILKILTGLIPGNAGDVRVNGISIAENPRLAKMHTSFMPENNPLPDHMRVGEYLRFRAELRGIPGNKIRARTEQAMRRCDLYHEARHRMIRTLSKGYRQRVGIADALLGNGDIVVLDEPTIGLDPHQILTTRKIIRAIGGTRTVLISSHILSELETICDHLIVINRGRIVADGALEDLIENTRDRHLFMARVRGDEMAARAAFGAVETQIISFKASSQAGEWTVQFSMADGDCRPLVKKIVADDALFLSSIGPVIPTIEEVFLRATRRCRDQDEDEKFLDAI
jgi:ABC-2 type transport system ATP-binding protein